MFGFSSSDHRSVVAIDIGSSSVGVAVLVTHPNTEFDILWHHREYALIHDDGSAAKQLKLIKTALTNAFLELSQSGVKALKEAGYPTDIREIQVVYSAPWSYTITKTISLKDEHPFTVDKDMVKELIESAKKQSKLVFATNKLAKLLGLEITHGDVISVSINDYKVTNPIDQEGRTMNLSYLETAIATEVSRTVIDSVEKFFPKATLRQYSFMYIFYLTLRNLQASTNEACLIDVTGEATEIGIIREGVLQHTTFAPTGMFNIARDLATLNDVPREEAFGYLKDTSRELSERLPKSLETKVQNVLETYQQALAEAFRRTGDQLSIPKTIYLHTDARTEQFFIEQIERAALEATGKPHVVHPITAKVLNLPEDKDMPLLVGANFLANKDQYMTILPHSV